MKYRKKEDKIWASFYTRFSNFRTRKPKPKDQSSFSRSMSTKGNGKTTRGTVEESSNGKVEAFTKAIGKVMWHMAMVD